MLEHIDLLRPLPPEGLARLAEHSRRRRFYAGATLVHQGDVSDSMQIVVKGRVQVARSHPELLQPLVLAELGPGEVVGEMGILDGEPRSATVIALEETETVELDAAALADTLLHYPDVAKALLRSLSRRLRDTDDLAEQMFLQAQDDSPR